MKPTFTPELLPVLDADVLDQINRQLGEARNIAGKLIETFSATARQHLARIQEALTSRDDATASRTAHALKGGALTIGLTRLAHICSHLEKHLSDEPGASPVTDEERREFADLIRREYDLALKALAHWPDRPS